MSRELSKRSYTGKPSRDLGPSLLEGRKITLRFPKGKETMKKTRKPTGRCHFDKAWIGKCNEPSGEHLRCKEHRSKTCSRCGQAAFQECSETYGLVCGTPLCDTCECGCVGRNRARIEKEKKMSEAQDIAVRLSKGEIETLASIMEKQKCRTYQDAIKYSIQLASQIYSK